ncbi:fluoroquinolone transport system permease protein [Tamaricihabitans halophyticus]|uniref:Fluoroquinolone transport system permease protein n=1 Tax=Tamaricihabitans halophyticus TaxID=1262583 RepID=A0A4R2QSI4_9PSEU|nr:fluoroquinolone transporter permease [Tamaricihabitans halophyticus]TCP49955.1 fluoroquinolone transport system permease protein [Tamaricihabitans halophyticus]
MSRLGIALRLEVTLQYRYRFLHAGIFSGLIWLALLLPMPADLRSAAEPYVIIGDLSIIGFFFIAGAVYFDKGERTVRALVASPLRFGEYLAAKVALLTALSLLVALVVATVTHGLDYHLGYLVAGVLLGTVVLLLASFISALPFNSISDWFLPSMLPLTLLLVPPIFHYVEVWQPAWIYLVPTLGPLNFLGAAFDQKTLAGWEIAYGIGYPMVVVLGMYLVAKRMFRRYVVARMGGA